MGDPVGPQRIDILLLGRLQPERSNPEKQKFTTEACRVWSSEALTHHLSQIHGGSGLRSTAPYDFELVSKSLTFHEHGISNRTVIFFGTQDYMICPG